MTDIPVLYGHSETENTAASATFVDAATIPAASFVANKEYLLIAVCALKGSAGTTDRGARLVHGTTPTVFTDAATVEDPAASDARDTVGWLFRFTQPGTAEDITVQFNLNSGSGTVTHMFSYIIAIQISDYLTENTDFYWNEATGDVSDATSPTSRASVTFTPNGTDAWLFVTQASWDVASAAVEFFHRLYDGSTGYGGDGTIGYISQDATNDLLNRLYPVALIPANASTTFAVQTQSSAAQTVRSSRIFALKLNKFAQFGRVYTAASDVVSNGGVWETEATLSPTPSATGNWVVLASALAEATAAGDNLFSRLQINPDGGGLVSNPAYGDDAPDNISGAAGAGTHITLATVVSLTSGAARAIKFDWTQAGTAAAVRERSLVAFSVALAGATTYNFTATLAGTSSLITAGKNMIEFAATLAGTSAVTAIGQTSYSITAILTGTSSLVAAGKNTITFTATLAGTSALTVVGTTTGLITFDATLAGTSSLVTAGKNTITFTATLAGTSSLVTAGKNTITFVATLAGTSSLISTGTIAGQIDFTAMLAGTSSLVAAGKNTIAFAATLAGTSSLIAAGKNTITFTATLAGTSSLAVAGSRSFSYVSTLAGTSLLTVVGNLIGEINFTANLVGTSSLVVAGRIEWIVVMIATADVNVNYAAGATANVASVRGTYVSPYHVTASEV